MAAKFKDARILNWIALVLLGVFPLFLWLIPSGTFDNTGVVICPSRFLFDIECFGCGITRAVLHFHHFELEEAVYHNPLIIAVYPGLVYIWYRWMRYLLDNLGILSK